MTYLIRAVGFANGVHCPHAGQWLKTFNHDAQQGRGYGTFTSDPLKALHFATAAAAMQFWAKQSSVNPIRPDGKPNKPLTALSVEVEPAP